MAWREDPAAYCWILASHLPKQSDQLANGLNAEELEFLAYTRS